MTEACIVGWAHSAFGRPGGMQLPKADIGAVFNRGGAAVASCVSILEPLR